MKYLVRRCPQQLEQFLRWESLTCAPTCHHRTLQCSETQLANFGFCSCYDLPGSQESIKLSPNAYLSRIGLQSRLHHQICSARLSSPFSLRYVRRLVTMKASMMPLAILAVAMVALLPTSSALPHRTLLQGDASNPTFPSCARIVYMSGLPFRCVI